MTVPATHFIGTVILDRFKSTRSNWEEHTTRSMIETSLWLLATGTAWQWSQGSMIFTVPFGSSMGVVVVLLSTIFGWGKPIGFSHTRRELSTEQDIKEKKEKAQSVSSSLAVRAVDVAGAVGVAGAATAKLNKTQTTRNRCAVYDWNEVALHNTMDDIWIVIHGVVYDVTLWGSKHPGGTIIYKYGGKDCSDQFEAFHHPHVKARLGAYKIGTMSAVSMEQLRTTTSPATLAYRELREKLWKNKYFVADPIYFYWKHALWASMILSSALMVAAGPQTWFTSLAAGCLLGLGWQQVAFVAHDALHNGIHEAKKGGGMNFLGWFLGSPIFGISASLWTEEHNVHHAITLRPREDPQFNYLPLWLISEKELLVKNPTGGDDKYQLNFMIKILISIQHWTFLPLTTLIGRFNFYLISLVFAVKQLIRGPTALHRYRSIMDLAGMTIYWCWFISLTSMLSSTKLRILFVLASHWTVGILHVQLLLSHLATDTFTEAEEDEIGFFRFQLGTSRNINVMKYEHWFHGGLEYQIEHHLFPQLPRHQLHIVKNMVMKICQENNIVYRSIGFTEAMSECLSNFKKLAYDMVTLEMG